MRAVNLLPGEEAQGRKAPPLPVLVACVGAVLVTAVLAVMFVSASGDVGKQRLALDQVNMELAAVPVPPAQSPVVSQLPKERQSRIGALAEALGARVAWDRLLREVSQVVPNDVWLNSLNAQAPILTAAAALAGSTTTELPQGFVIQGCTYSQDSVARFLARLDVVPDLSDMTLGKSEAQDSNSGSAGGGGGNTCAANLVSFTLQGNVRAAGAATP